MSKLHCNNCSTSNSYLFGILRSSINQLLLLLLLWLGSPNSPSCQLIVRTDIPEPGQSKRFHWVTGCDTTAAASLCDECVKSDSCVPSTTSVAVEITNCRMDDSFPTITSHIGCQVIYKFVNRSIDSNRFRRICFCPMYSQPSRNSRPFSFHQKKIQQLIVFEAMHQLGRNYVVSGAVLRHTFHNFVYDK